MGVLCDDIAHCSSCCSVTAICVASSRILASRKCSSLHERDKHDFCGSAAYVCTNPCTLSCAAACASHRLIIFFMFFFCLVVNPLAGRPGFNCFPPPDSV